MSPGRYAESYPGEVRKLSKASGSDLIFLGGGKSFGCVFFPLKFDRRCFMMFWGSCSLQIIHELVKKHLTIECTEYTLIWVPYWVDGVLEFFFAGLSISSLKKNAMVYSCIGKNWLVCWLFGSSFPVVSFSCHLVVFIIIMDYPWSHTARNIHGISTHFSLTQP